MNSFTDTLGRKWNLALDFDLHEQVREKCDVTLLAIGDDQFALLARLHEDIALLVDVLWAMCEDQAESNGIVATEAMPATRQFAKGLGGDVLENAAKALVDAVIDFFPSQARRDAVREVLLKAHAMSDAMLEKASERVRSIDPRQLAESFGDLSTSTPPSPASATHAQPAE